MDGINEMPTPMSSTLKLDKDEDGKLVHRWLYRGMIGSLLCLTASRPDIMFATYLCARFQSNPKESHLTSYKQIFCYLIRTIGFGLWYPSSLDFNLIPYSGVAYGGCKLDRNSTSGTCHFLSSCLVS